MALPANPTIIKSNKRWLHQLALGYLALFVLVALSVDWLPLSFSPNDIDLDHVYQEPFQWESEEAGKPFHWLGTDQLGRDLFTNILFGARVALLVSIPAMIIATLTGLFLGCIAGYFGDKGLRISVATIPAAILATVFFIFYGLYANSWLSDYLHVASWMVGAVALLFSILLYGIVSKLFSSVKRKKKNIYLPIDMLLLKTIEIIQTVPRLLLILCLAAFVAPSITNIIFLAVLTYWPAIALLARAEVIKVRALPYIEAAKVLGFSEARIIVKHVLPNILTPVMVAFTFGVANLMALESTLSFLGIGIPADVPSWGRAITGIRTNFSAWWLVVFPGVVLCITVLALQAANQFILRKLDPKANI